MEPTPKNVKPGTYLRTSNKMLPDFPDTLYKCKIFKWFGDTSPKNNIIFEIVFDEKNEDEGDSWDVFEGFDGYWDEIMPTFKVYKNKREVLKDMIENPIKRKI